jgi:hypothetical protein
MDLFYRSHEQKFRVVDLVVEETGLVVVFVGDKDDIVIISSSSDRYTLYSFY